MNVSGNTILVTGGAPGIGLAAERRRLEANAVFDQWFECMNRRPPR